MISRPNMMAMLADLVKSGTLILRASAVPVDGTTGTNLTNKGSLYIDTLNGEIYINTGTSAATAWKKITHA